MAAGAWMPLYVADYLADTGHLSTEEHGAYLLMMMHYWQHGSLPDDDAKLARITRMSLKKFKLTRSQLAELFSPNWKHKRIEAEIAKSSDIKDKRRDAANKRYSKHPANAGANADADASPTRVPTITITEENPIVPSQDDGFEPAWSAFPTQRKGSKEKAIAAWRGAFRRHLDLTSDGVTSAIIAYAASDEVARGFAKGMAAWLNDDRWLVDYSSVGPGLPKLPISSPNPPHPVEALPRDNSIVRAIDRALTRGDKPKAKEIYRAAETSMTDAERMAKAYLEEAA